MPQPGLAQLSLELPATEPVEAPPRAPLRPATPPAPRRLRLTLGEAARIMREAVEDSPTGRRRSVSRSPTSSVGSGTNTGRPRRRCATTKRSYPSWRSTMPTSSSRPSSRPREPLASASSSTSAGAKPRRGRARRCARSHVVLPLGTGRVQAPGQPGRSDPEPAAARHRAAVVRPRRRRPDCRRSARAPRSRRSKLLFLIGIRKGSLAQLRLKDFDLGRRRVRVHSKGGKIGTCRSHRGAAAGA